MVDKLLPMPAPTQARLAQTRRWRTAPRPAFPDAALGVWLGALACLAGRASGRGSRRTCWRSASAGCSGCRSAWAWASPAISPCRSSRRSGPARPLCSSLAAAAGRPLVARPATLVPGWRRRPGSAWARSCWASRSRRCARELVGSAGAGAARRLRARGDGPAGRGSASTASACTLGEPVDRGPRRRRRRRRRSGSACAPLEPACRAGRPGSPARAAHAAVAAGRAARLRLRPSRLFHAARRGRLRARRAADARSRADRRSWSLGRLRAAPDDRGRDHQRPSPGPAGAIAVALLTGLRGALPDQIWDDWAVAGIIHLLSISGLHLALVAGTLFFAVRIALALAPPLALRLPAKKLAALLALIGAFGYLLISGASVPTRALLHHDRAHAARGHGRPQPVLHAAGRLRGPRRAAAAAGKPARRLVSDVVRRRGRPDRGLRDRGRQAPGRSPWASTGA